MKKVLVLVLAGCFVVSLLPSAANAGGDKWTFKNETGVTAYDLHIDFKNGCTFDAANSTPFTYDDGTNGTSANHHLDGGADVADGGTATVRFTTTGSPPRIKTWYWTDNTGNQLGSSHSGPPLASVSISATVDGNEITISYSANSRIRAFAFDISADSGAVIEGLVPGSYKVGESNSGNKGYGIFMGSIDLSDVNNPVWNTPVAPANDPCAGAGLGTSTATLEMGSLYIPVSGNDSNAPAYSGDLMKFFVDGDCTVTISTNSRRGGIVMEDPDQVVDHNLPIIAIAVVESICYTGPDYTEWVAVGEPNSWCYPKQCHGDATGSDESFSRQSVAVGLQDVLLLLTGYNQSGYSDPVTHPWIAADFTHSSESFSRQSVRVGLQDVLVLLDYYNDLTSTVPADCLD